jgi:phosphopentomutase
MVDKVVLFIIDGMDVVNFVLGDTPTMGGLHGRTAVGVAHTEILGAGTNITPVAHAMMGTGQNVIALRPGKATTGRPYTYTGEAATTIGDVAREAGIPTAAIGKNEAAIVLGGTDVLDISRLERDGISANDDRPIVKETKAVLKAMPKRGLIVINYNGVDYAAHVGDVRQVIAAVEKADAMVREILDATHPSDALMVIASDHGTNPLTKRHSTVPTPLVLINKKLRGRVNLGVVHNLEIAVTIASALGLRLPNALGRDLFELALQGGSLDTGDYRKTLERQFKDYLASQVRLPGKVDKS